MDSVTNKSNYSSLEAILRATEQSAAQALNRNPQRSANAAEDYAEEPNCGNENFFSSVLAPSIKGALPAEDSIAGKMLNHVSGLYTFLNNVSSDLCENNRMSEKSASGTAGFFSRSTTSVAVTTTTLWFAALGAVATGPAAALGALAVGGAALVIAPPVAEALVSRAVTYTNGLLDSTKEWIQGIRQN